MELITCLKQEDGKPIRLGIAMTIGDKVYAAKSMTYGGKKLDRRQVFELKGFRLDEALLRQERAVPVSNDAELYECGKCGAVFVDITSRTVHGNNRHG